MCRHEDAREREATANLLFLLSYTHKLDVTAPEIRRLTEQRAPLSEILFWVIAHRLWDAVHPDSGCRGYVSIEDRLDVLKGRWLVAAQAPKAFGAGDGTASTSPTTNLPRTTSPTGSSKPPSIASPGGRSGKVTTKYETVGGTRSVASEFPAGCHSELARNLWLLSAMVA
jgi:hypothetical protein